MPFRTCVDGAHGVDDVGAWEGVGGGELGAAGGAAIQATAFCEEGGTGGGVDGAILLGGWVGLVRVFGVILGDIENGVWEGGDLQRRRHRVKIHLLH